MSSVSHAVWQHPPASLALREKSVHLWRFPLLAELGDAALLSTDEKARMQRLRAPGKAQGFLVSRTCLRQILGRYLTTLPQNITLAYSEFGKPSLADRKLSFNLSHSGGWGLCAITPDRDIGVDLEAINPALDFLSLAQRFFSPAEIHWLAASSTARQRRNFFRLWTRKEAWLKGKGKGFSEPELQLDPVHLSVASATANGWWVENFPVKRGYVGALAVRGEVERVEKYQLLSAC